MLKHTNYNMNQKQSMNSWRNFLTEAAALPARKRVSVPDGAWPLLKPSRAATTSLSNSSLRAARAALGGNNKSDLKPKDIFALHDNLDQASINLGADLTTVVGKNICKDDVRASAVTLYFDLNEPVPGHDFGVEIGFQTDGDFDKFIKLLTSAAKSSSIMGTLGQVPCFYVPPEGTGPISGYVQVTETSKVTVGLSPVWNHKTERQERAVVLAWGDIGEGHTTEGTGPYFLSPSAVLSMTRQWVALTAPLIKRNDGSVYQYPATLPPPDELEKACKKADDDRNRATVGPKRTKDIKLGGISI